MKVSLSPLLCCICVVLLATLQSPARGEQFFIVEEDTEEEIIAEEENESYVDGEDNPIPHNLDDVLETENICSRYSPKEVFHTVINPYLFKILDEMSVFVEAVLQRVEAALYTLMPHVAQSPTGKLKVEELFPEVQTFMFGTMKNVYNDVRQAWRELIISYVKKPSSPHHTLAALAHVMEVQNQGEKQLVESLQEFSIFLKAVVYNSIQVIETSLHIPNNTDDHEAVLAITHKLPKVAPNFLGTVMYKLLIKGSDSSAYGKTLTNPLRSIVPLVEKMHAELKAIIDRRGGIGEIEEAEEEEAMEAFWKSAIEASHFHLEEWPLLDEDFELIYSNEEYLSEVLLQMMTTF